MRFLSTAVLAVSALANCVFAAPQATETSASTSAPAPTGGSKPNPISFPTAGSQCTAGEPCTITWNADSGDTVTLRLRKGDSDNLDTVETIIENIPNSGSYTWTPDDDLEGDDTYAIEIVDDEGNANYSPQFTLNSDGSGLTTTGTATTATKTTTGSVSASTSTSSSTSTSTSIETTVTTAASTTTTVSGTTTSFSNATSTSATRTTPSTRRPTPTDDSEAPNPNGTGSANGLLSAQSPLALILCVGAALAYLS